jgi:hypothetical protein
MNITSSNWFFFDAIAIDFTIEVSETLDKSLIWNITFIIYLVYTTSNKSIKNRFCNSPSLFPTYLVGNSNIFALRGIQTIYPG